MPDEDNPRGYFEHEGVKHSRSDLSWLEQAGGKVVKVVHLLLPHLPAGRNYRVIFMLRDLEEVIVSQRVMLKHQGRPAVRLTDAALAGVFEKQLATVREWLAQQPNVHVLYLNYRDVIGHPLVVAGQINHFLQWKLAGRRHGRRRGSVTLSPAEIRAGESCLNGRLGDDSFSVGFINASGPS